MRILVIDVGGTHVKVLANRSQEVVGNSVRSENDTGEDGRCGASRHADGNTMPSRLAYPGPVVGVAPSLNPTTLGGGWVGFDSRRRLTGNKDYQDAAMQALGSYQGGRMLFLVWAPDWLCPDR